ncbi:MAG: ABC transporter permease [Thermotogota bacterium]
MKRHLVLIILLASLCALTGWMTSLGRVGFFTMAPSAKLLSAVEEHLQIVLTAELLAVAVGIPVGIALSRKSLRRGAPVLSAMTSIGQTVPTLALVGVFSILMGLGLRSAIVALSVYTLLPIVRNTYAGLVSIDPRVKEAARGMGMSTSQILWRVEMPLAAPLVMAGIRTSTVLNVGSAAVAGMIGAGGLGEIIMTGVSLRLVEMVLQGAAPTAALAILLDRLLESVATTATPRGLRLSLRRGSP